jgi:hypothetical protein
MKTDRRSKGGAVLFRNLPPETKLRFHAACVREGLTMRKAVELLMRLYAQDRELRRAVKREGK